MDSFKHLKNGVKSREVIYECTFCGSRFPEGTKECPNCGASPKDAKKVRDSLEMNIKLNNEYNKARQEYLVFTVLSILCPIALFSPLFAFSFFGTVPMIIWLCWRLYNKKKVHLVSIIFSLVSLFEFVGLCSMMIKELYYWF